MNPKTNSQKLTLIDRPNYTNKLLSYLDKPVIKILVGIRRAGKSSIMQLVIQKLQEKGIPKHNIIYINKEHVDFADITNYKELYDYIHKQLGKASNKHPKYVFIDEVQKIADWQKTVTDLLAKNTADIILSGSNSTLLGGHLATLLSGRYVTIPVYPLSFKEFVYFNEQIQNLKNASHQKSTSQTSTLPQQVTSPIEQLFNTYLQYGGLPALPKILDNTQFVIEYLQNVLDTIIYKDILQYYNIKNLKIFDHILRFLFENISNITSGRNIVNYFKNQQLSIAPETVLNYIKYLETAFIFDTVKRYDLQGKRYLDIYEKLYTTDLGLRTALIGYNPNDINKLLENVVYNELKTRGYTVSIGKLNGSEIDFIAEQNNYKHYYQVTYLLPDKSTIQREFGNLLKIKDNYPKTVLSMDKFFGGGTTSTNYEGIEHKNIIEFLLAN